METRPEKSLVVITGPTASGKSSLAMELARRYDGEIIAADSRTVYRYMDIGTAKPSQQDQAAVPHWGIDLVEPGESYSAAQFKAYAYEKIADIRARGKVPFLVGGTGLYIDGVVFDYQFGTPADEDRRHELSNMSVDALRMYCSENNIMLPENEHNKRHLIRSIEQHGEGKQRRERPLSNTIIVGITTYKSELEHRIRQRAEQLFDDGVVEEAILLGKKYGWNSEAMTGNVYPLVRKYCDEGGSIDELQRQFARSDRQLAKRQMTWLRRNPYILWTTRTEAEHHVAAQLDAL